MKRHENTNRTIQLAIKEEVIATLINRGDILLEDVKPLNTTSKQRVRKMLLSSISCRSTDIQQGHIV